MKNILTISLLSLSLLSACGQGDTQPKPSPSPSSSASTGPAKVWTESELDGAITCMTSKFPNDSAAASVRAQYDIAIGQKGQLTAAQLQATLNTLGTALITAEAARSTASGCIK